MGRKRRLPARAREKLVGEEVATAMEVDQKESVLQAKPDDALFVVDAVGEGESKRLRWGWQGVVVRPLMTTTSVVCCLVLATRAFDGCLMKPLTTFEMDSWLVEPSALF